jgi:putative flippase GtrA
MKRLFWFVFAGSSGFAIDAALTQALVAWTSLGPFFARIPAIAAAMAFTWFVNRSRTFGPSSRSLAVEGFRYWAVGITSALLNYAIYSTLIYRAPQLQPVVAIVFASLAAMAYSYFGYSRFVFRR